AQGGHRPQSAPSAANEAAEGRQPEKADAQGRRTLIGTAGQIKEQLHELQNLYGADEFLIVTQVADYAQRLKSYELLASCIIGPGRR
ncbi:LLM class flavin-dependent oxidoreductase, partial [Paenibacillus chitinolyticus]|nr:LLM class flavin-dependent oxidoreductase [Paenibacillus chitinolyticus]